MMKDMSPVRSRRSGFTLLETLVVISIIGILISMLAVAFGTAQRKARDSKRRGDIKSLQNAYEQYYAANSGYAAGPSCDAMEVTTFLPAGEPTDPQGGTYTCVSTASTYCVCALLEEASRGNASADAGAGGICSFGSGDYYCLSNLQ